MLPRAAPRPRTGACTLGVPPPLLAHLISSSFPVGRRKFQKINCLPTMLDRRLKRRHLLMTQLTQRRACCPGLSRGAHVAQVCPECLHSVVVPPQPAHFRLSSLPVGCRKFEQIDLPDDAGFGPAHQEAASAYPETINKELLAIEFTRTRDARSNYVEKAIAVAQEQYTSLLTGLHAVGQVKGWKVQQLVFVGGTCGSVHVESFNKNMKALGVLESKWDLIRQKLVRRLLGSRTKCYGPTSNRKVEREVKKGGGDSGQGSGTCQVGHVCMKGAWGPKLND
jgi:hypothetical protein